MENLTHLPKLPSFGNVKKMSPLARREYRNGILFLLPWFIGFIAFTFLPMIATLFFTFIDMKITTGVLTTPKWVGLANYALLFKDNAVWNATPKQLTGSLMDHLPVRYHCPAGRASWCRWG